MAELYVEAGVNSGTTASSSTGKSFIPSNLVAPPPGAKNVRYTLRLTCYNAGLGTWYNGAEKAIYDPATTFWVTYDAWAPSEDESYQRGQIYSNSSGEVVDTATIGTPWYNGSAGASIRVYYTVFPSMQVNIGGVWREPQEGQVNIGGVWRQIDDAKANIGSVWRST